MAQKSKPIYKVISLLPLSPPTHSLPTTHTGYCYFNSIFKSILSFKKIQINVYVYFLPSFLRQMITYFAHSSLSCFYHQKL